MTGTSLPGGLKRRLPEGLLLTAVALTVAVMLCAGCFLFSAAHAPEESILQAETIRAVQVKRTFPTGKVTILAEGKTYTADLTRSQRKQLEQAVADGEGLHILSETNGQIWHIRADSGVIVSFSQAIEHHREWGWRASSALALLPLLLWAYVMRVTFIARDPSRYPERTLKRHWRR